MKTKYKYGKRIKIVNVAQMGKCFYIKTLKERCINYYLTNNSTKKRKKKTLNTKEKKNQDERASRAAGFTAGKPLAIVGFSADGTTTTLRPLGAS